MFLRLDAARRFQQVVFAAWTATDWPQQELMARARISSSRRNSIWRASHSAGPEIELQEAHRIITVVADELRFGGEIAWNWILGKVSEIPPSIFELIVSSWLHPRSSRALAYSLDKFEAKASSQLSYSIVPKLSALSEDIVETVHGNCTKLLGAKGVRIRAALNAFYRTRREGRIKGEQRPFAQTHLYLRSDFLQFSRGSGLFSGLSSEQRAQAIEEFAIDTIDLHGNRVGIIDDLSPKIPRDLIAHFRKFEAVFILDGDFLFKVHPGGLRRSMCVSVDEVSKAHIGNELAKLQELERYVSNEWTRTGMKDGILTFVRECGC
jgi:hypothetical protein